MERYTQLAREQRYQIYSLRKNGFTQSQIADHLGVHKSTISRELRRNSTLSGAYIPAFAHRKSLARRDRRKQGHISNTTWVWVKWLLKNDWSPEQISLWLYQYDQTRISHEWIYQFVYKNKAKGGDLYTHLRSKKKRRLRYGSYKWRSGPVKNRVSIDERAEIVNKRTRLGDWEVDTIIGKNRKNAIVSITERTARYTRLAIVTIKNAKTVSQAIIDVLGASSMATKTITSDNGSEFADHQQIAKSLKVKYYFAHPYSSWERGSNENTNGLVRQYFPKGSDFSELTEQDMTWVEEKLNNRPRKCLNMKTPNQVMFGIDPMVALDG